jgi:hypothetical protein
MPPISAPRGAEKKASETAMRIFSSAPGAYSITNGHSGVLH